jgi:large subunit ribosomal protein L22
MKKQLREVSTANLRNVRVSPRKARLVADMIRGERVTEALRRLQFCDKKSAAMLSKLLMSAISNAKDKTQVDIDDLVITKLTVDMGRTLKRYLPRAQGRASNIRKRSSHISMELGL